MYSSKLRRDNISRLTRMLLCIALVSLLTACDSDGKLTEATMEKDYEYTQADTPVKLSDGIIGDMSVNGEYIYISIINSQGDKMQTLDYMMSLADKSLSEMTGIDTDYQKDWTFVMKPDDNGNLVQMLRKNDTVQGADHPILLMKYKSDGTIECEQDITEFITQADFTDGDRGDVVEVFPMDNNELVIVMRYQIIVISDDYRSAQYISLEEGEILSAARMKDDRIVCGIENDDKHMLQVVNWKRKKWDNKKLYVDWTFDRLQKEELLDGAQYDFYYKYRDGMYGVDWKDKVYTEILDYEKAGVPINLSMERTVLPLQDGRLLVMVFLEDETIELREYVVK